MNAIQACLAFLLTSVAVLSGETLRPTKFVLLIGQSNMAGRGEMEAADRQSMPRCLMLDKSMNWVPAHSPVSFDKPSAGVSICESFSAAYTKDHPNEILGLVPCALGGSALAQWAPGKPLYTNAVARARFALKGAQVIAILWHQGETDLSSKNSDQLIATYPKRFTEMIQRLQKDIGAEKIPLVLGEIGRNDCGFHWPKPERYNNTVLPFLAKSLPRCGYATSEGLMCKSDKAHFTRAAYFELGRRYYAVFAKLQKAP